MNVTLPGHGEHYRWNKVNTSVKNDLWNSQRVISHYGELVLTNNKSIRCVLQFVKPSLFSSNTHEVVGSVIDKDGAVVHRLFGKIIISPVAWHFHSFIPCKLGKWSEGLFCGEHPSARCVWRPEPLPEDNKRYYGFSRFAIELNELEPGLVRVLPPTDSRFRPDQRLLEEGKVPEAKASKKQLEETQKERLIANEQRGKHQEPKWFRRTAVALDDKDGDKYEFTNTYWDAKDHSKFGDMDLVRLW